MTILFSIYKLSLVGFSSIIPNLFSKAMLLIIFPVALILASIKILKNSLSVRFAFLEMPLVVFTICEYFTTIAMWLIQKEIPLVLSAVLPKHNTNSILDIFANCKPKGYY